MSHGNNGGIVLKRIDGTAMSAKEVIIKRRGAMLWLPVLCSNDLVHGSWWFVWGSVATTLTAVYPLLNRRYQFYANQDDFMPSTDFDVTWGLLIVSGIFFIAGSYAFVHAFEEPHRQPYFHWNKHLQTDELLGAWLFLFGTAPAVPYMLLFFILDPSAFFFLSLLGACIFVFASYLFVLSCYPSDKKYENIVLPRCTRLFGSQMWVVKHLANDWLAGTWFFLWANVLLTFGSIMLLLIALGINSPNEIFIWLTGSICSILFLIGSAYFVAGSYPHATQFYYSTTSERTHGITEPGNELEAGIAVIGKGLGLGLSLSVEATKRLSLSTMNSMGINSTWESGGGDDNEGVHAGAANPMHHSFQQHQQQHSYHVSSSSSSSQISPMPLSRVAAVHDDSTTQRCAAGPAAAGNSNSSLSLQLELPMTVAPSTQQPLASTSHRMPGRGASIVSPLHQQGLQLSTSSSSVPSTAETIGKKVPPPLEVGSSISRESNSASGRSNNTKTKKADGASSATLTSVSIENAASPSIPISSDYQSASNESSIVWPSSSTDATTSSYQRLQRIAVSSAAAAPPIVSPSSAAHSVPLPVVSESDDDEGGNDDDDSSDD